MEDEIFIENAGLVIVSAYLPMLFEEVGLTSESKFNSDKSQEQATTLLQYIMLDNPPLDEHHLVLNKLLCGMNIDRPISTPISPNKKYTDLIHGLIEAAIHHWSIIGNSSVEGFRGSWLWRKGKLERKDESWELMVEQHSYDMLLDQLPFTITPIKYDWMVKPIVVKWR